MINEWAEKKEREGDLSETEGPKKPPRFLGKQAKTAESHS